MAPILSLLFILFLLWLINRIATVALVLTGLSMDASSFQVRSALLGIGFTTQESEMIVQHPVRRQIFLLLMLAGNTGIISAMVSLIIGFTDAESSMSIGMRLGMIFTGIFCFYLIARSRWIERHLFRLITWALKTFTRLDVRDYENLMQLSEGYGIGEVKVREGEWWANLEIGELGIGEEGVLVLGIYRTGGEYIGGPTAHTRIEPGDNLILYGLTEVIDGIDEAPPANRKFTQPSA